MPPYGAVPPYQPVPASPPARGRGPVLLVVLAAAAVVAVMLAVAAVAILVLPDDETSGPVSSGPVDLRQPLTFQLVAQESRPPCSGGALQSPDGSSCYTFGPDALTVRRLEEVRAMAPDPAKGRTAWSVGITLTSGDATGFATLTGKAAQAFQNQLPAGYMGMLVGGALVSSPAQVVAPISGGKVEINGPQQTFTRSYVEGIVKRLTGE
ncbi:hypothetical protein [Actinomadura sp. 9N215]|uniref:hypothetical protein n=1 Tax=Actinomadura sp. 9N215 TaxID=3375150 RepID=UPI00379BCA32